MPITQMLKEARAAGKTTVVVYDGVWSLHWVDDRGRNRHVPQQIWMFVPRS
jgi:hypothetical protein